MDNGLGKNDPYRNMDSAQKNIRPELSGHPADTRSADSNGAAAFLSSAETGAAQSPSQSEGGLDSVRQNEQEGGTIPQSGFYSGTGKPSPTGIKGRGKGFFKKGKPLIFTTMILSIVMFGTASFGGLTSQIISWKENLYSMFGQSSAVINRRSNTIFRRALNTNKSVTSTFGNKLKVSSKLAQKLEAENIHYVETTDADGKDLRMLVFQDADGSYIPVVATDADVVRANNVPEVDINGETVRLTQSMTLDDAKISNKNFDVSLDTATMTFTGKIAGWFDDVTTALYDRIVGSGARNKTDLSDPSEDEVDKMLLGNASDGTKDSDIDVTKQTTDEDGNPVSEKLGSGDTFVDGDGNSTNFTDISNESDGLRPVDATNPKAAEASISGSLKAKVKKIAAASPSLACGFLQSVGAISTVVGAIQTANVISYASKYLEIADKIKAGDADAVTNLAMNNINESVKTTAYDINGNEVELEGPVSSSAGWNAVFAEQNIINENDPSALMNNREYTTQNALRNLGTNSLLASVAGAIAGYGGGIAAFRMCNNIQAAAGVVGGISDMVLLLTTGGIGNAIKKFLASAVEGIFFTAITTAVFAVIGMVTPMIANWLVGNLSNVFLGKNGGFALLSGAQNVMNSNLQMGTGRYADRDNAVEVFALTRDVETQWAAYERATKSPFDASSKYTFLGSLVNSAIPYLNMTNNTVTSSIVPVANLVRSSALALISPTASAANDISKFSASLASDDNCAYLQSVGVAGDAMCNKYSGAYVNEISSMDPETVYQNVDSYEVDGQKSFEGEDSDGNPQVNKKSEYAKYIVACVTSDTQPGTISSTVEGFIQSITTTDSAVANGLINFGMNFIPGSGFLDAIDAVEQERNFVWNSGLACTGNTDDQGLNERVKNYSMYNLDQRVLENMGLINKNSTVAFLEDYYEENPLDRSFEGQIARISGMTKEQVSDTLALIDYYNYIAQYDPSTRYQMGEESPEPQPLDFGGQTIGQNDGFIVYDATLWDSRQRNYAVA